MPICPKCHNRSEDLGGACPRDDHYFIPDTSLNDVAAEPRLGTRFADRFIPLRIIAHTRLATLFEALQLPVRRRVALKILDHDLRHSSRARERFSREARAISSLTHPNAITLHDFGLDDEGRPFLVTELTLGPTLTEWALDPEMTLDRLLAVWSDLLAAMAEAHERGIVHRTLHPDNLIVTRAGHRPDMIKIRDFGLVKLTATRQQRQLTGDEESLGEPAYMAPEQTKNPDEVGPASDVYSLGILLFECLTGAPPFEAESPMDLVFEHLTTPLPDLNARSRFELPEGLVDLIDLATAKDPEKRISSARAFSAAFQNVVGHTAHDTSPTPAPAPTDTSEPDTDELQRRPSVDSSNYERTLESHSLEGRADQLDDYPLAPSPDSSPDPTKPSSPSDEPSTASPSSSGVPTWLLVGGGLVLFFLLASLSAALTWYLLAS